MDASKRGRFQNNLYKTKVMIIIIIIIIITIIIFIFMDERMFAVRRKSVLFGKVR